MTRSPGTHALVLAFATILLAVALPATAQDTPAGEIMIFSGDNDGVTGTGDFYIINNTRTPVSFVGDPGWPFHDPFPASYAMSPWEVWASTSVDLGTQAGHKSIVFLIFPSGKSTVSFNIVNVTYAHTKQVDWILTDSTQYPGNWVFTDDTRPQVDPNTGACTYTNDDSTAIANQDFVISLSKVYWGDKVNKQARSKVILMVSEITPSGQATYKGCKAFP